MEKIQTSYHKIIYMKTKDVGMMENIVTEMTNSFILNPKEIDSIYISPVRVAITIGGKDYNFALAGSFIADSIPDGEIKEVEESEMLCEVAP